MTDRTAPFGLRSFGWAYWQSRAAAQRRAEARAEAVEFVRIASGAIAFAALAYAWTVLFFCL